mmetsp:Transcript_1514/g.4793  ORF Transcript_1514/g.4793 Transcript_1514/m.4793 type:complete len:233 (-) Transcript_1514:224-922(-)
MGLVQMVADEADSPASSTRSPMERDASVCAPCGGTTSTSGSITPSCSARCDQSWMAMPAAARSLSGRAPAPSPLPACSGFGRRWPVDTSHHSALNCALFRPSSAGTSPALPLPPPLLPGSTSFFHTSTTASNASSARSTVKPMWPTSSVRDSSRSMRPLLSESSAAKAARASRRPCIISVSSLKVTTPSLATSASASAAAASSRVTPLAAPCLSASSRRSSSTSSPLDESAS